MSKIIATEKEILYMHKHGMSYSMIASVVGTSRQNIHRIVKYKQHPTGLQLKFFGYLIYIKVIKL